MMILFFASVSFNSDVFLSKKFLESKKLFF